jgi:hypothetical protein
MMALQPTPAESILSIIENAAGLNALAQSILGQSQAHEKNPELANWVESQAGTDWKTGQASDPIYFWSDETLEWLSMPLQDALAQTKNEISLQNQCWTVQSGITQVGTTAASSASPKSALDQAESTYTVKQLTPQSGVENDFSYDPSSSTATVNFKNYYLRWLQISVDQYGPDGETVGSTAGLGYLAPVDTIMAAPLPPDWSPFSFTLNERANSAIVSLGGLGQVPYSWKYDWQGVLLTALFNYAVPTLFISLGVAVDQTGSWSDLQKSIAGKILTVLEAAAEGPIGGAVTESISAEDVLAAIANCLGSLLLDAVAGSEALEAYVTLAVGESAAEDAAPFVGWIARAIGSVADVASMIETSVEVANSPATMSIDIVRTMDVQVTVNPDVNHQNQWPATATHYTVTITYDDGPIYTYTGQMQSTTQEGPIVQTFQTLPAGGSLTVLAVFYSGTDWLAGQGSTGSVTAQPNQDTTLVVPPFNITENLVPLTSTTTTFRRRLNTTAAKGAFGRVRKMQLRRPQR